MFGDYSQDLLRTGITELKSGNRETARHYLDRALYMSGDHDVIAETWYWISQTTDDAQERRDALENCLANDLHHSRARRALAILDGRLSPEDVIDPDALRAAPGIGQGEAGRFVCAKCGGRMVYSPDGQSLVCEYCRRHQHLDRRELRPAEKDFIVALATARGHGKPLREQVVSCQGCGAEFILPGRSLSFSCTYCGSAHVVRSGQGKGLLEPDGIIPHAFDQLHATDVLSDWMRAHGVEDDGPAVGLRGLYVPIWTFELVGEIRYTGEISRQRGNAYTDMPTVKESVEGRYPILMKVPVAASRRPSAPLVRLIERFDLKSIQPYDARFLAAWPAELYDVSMADASLEARSRAYASLRQDLPDLLAPVRVVSTSSADLAIDTFRLDLLPVWFTEVIVEGRREIVLISGQNGAVEGESRGGKKSPGSGLLVWLEDFLTER